jgi:DNA-binding NarL/FixJ family response regulator
VLLADDYTELLATFERMLAPSCDVVGSVADGAALLEAATRLRPDVIVVDLFIPPSNGFEICRQIKHIAPTTQVIIVSASADADLIKEALRAGAAAFVAKFRAGDDLLPAIHRAMASRSGADL